jgi:hypothetical protein
MAAVFGEVIRKRENGWRDADKTQKKREKERVEGNKRRILVQTKDF